MARHIRTNRGQTDSTIENISAEENTMASSDKISGQELMDCMAAEFDRLDSNKNGEFDVKELSTLLPGRGSGCYQ